MVAHIPVTKRNPGMRAVFEFKYTPRPIREGVRTVVLAAGLDTATFKLGEEEDINSQAP